MTFCILAIEYCKKAGFSSVGWNWCEVAAGMDLGCLRAGTTTSSPRHTNHGQSTLHSSQIIDRLHENWADHLAAMSTQAAGNTYLPFVDLMRLETINEVTYRSTAQPFCPGGSLSKSMGRAYGGHVYAQASWAAAQTVPEGFVLHVSHLRGLGSLPYSGVMRS
jgi:hypothetical protein